jgi:autoinducer 2-degrading protein
MTISLQKALLARVYRALAAPARQEESVHSQKKRDMVAEIMAKPRSSKYDNVFPDDEGWG